jgi:phenylacetate-CoA ligase
MLTPLEPWISAKIGLTPDVPLTLTAIRDYQLQQLRTTVEYARSHSPFYRRQLAEIRGQDIRSLDDIARLPFTTPAALREDDLRFLCVSRNKIERVVTLCSSGTTAPAKRLHFTAADLELTVDFFQHGMSTLVQPGQRVLILMPGELPGSVGDLLFRGLERIGVQGIIHGIVQDRAAAIAEIITQEINCIVGIPVQVLALARHAAAAAIPTGRIKSVLLSADYVPLAIVREIERRWGCPVFSHYGMTEMGLGGAVDCLARSGCHIREADLYLEIVDPVSGQPVPAGEQGEVVFTTLNRSGMPLVRYRTGDLACFIPGTCPCGTVLPRLGRITGRIANQVSLNDGQLLTMSELDEALFPLPFLLNFQVEFQKVHGLDLLNLTVESLLTCPDELKRQILQALMTIPVLASALTGHRLLLGDIQQEPLPVSGPVKRTIIDTRKDTTC